MGFVAAILLVVLALVTAILLLAAATSDRILEPAPWQALVGGFGVVVGAPMLILSGEGAFILALSLSNLVAGGVGMLRRGAE